MAHFHVYFISSLPMLHFGMRPPFSPEEFLKKCDGLLPQEEIELLSSLKNGYAPAAEARQPTLGQWRMFDTALRNELAKIRASRRHEEPQKFLRHETYAEPSVVHRALNAFRNPSILEAEKMLDEERWSVLEELVKGHYFDTDVLIVYFLKLLILERWESIRTADKAHLLAGVLS